jgi:hypothetical protein
VRRLFGQVAGDDGCAHFIIIFGVGSCWEILDNLLLCMSRPLRHRLNLPHRLELNCV